MPRRKKERDVKCHEMQLVDLTHYVLNNMTDEYLKNYILKKCCWSWTERYGKHSEDYLPWSESALNIMAKLKKIKDRKKYVKERDKLLRHEHMIPMVIIKDILYDLAEKSKDNIKRVFEKKVCAAIVTTEEDKVINKKKLRQKMPPDRKDVWARYDACDIKFSSTERDKIH